MGYFEKVLEYYRTADNPSFGEWPTDVIGYELIEKSSNFYKAASQWFSDRGVDIIVHNGKRRFLSTFILAAEFPHSLGFQQHVEKIVRRNGWLTLYRNPQGCLDEYVESVDLKNITLTERQFLTINSEGYVAFLELLTILSSIRFLLGKYETLEEICMKLASNCLKDIDTIHRIAETYKNTLIPEETHIQELPSPRFEYGLNNIDGEDILVLRHNLNKKVQIPSASSIDLNRYSLASFNGLAGDENLSFSRASNVVSIEKREAIIDADFGVQKDFFLLKKRNSKLKNIIFYLTVTDKNHESCSLQIGKIERNEDFLVFDANGKEISQHSRSFNLGVPLKFVPLTRELGEALKESIYFSQLDSSSIPIFTQDIHLEKIELGGLSLTFSNIPFSIEIRSQTPLEKLFKTGHGVVGYFYSSIISFNLLGDFEGVPEPTIKFERLVRSKQKGIIYISIPIEKSGNTYKTRSLLKDPGLYKITVFFNEREKQFKKIKILPVRSMQLLGEKKIKLRMMKTPKSFYLVGEHEYLYSVVDSSIILNFPTYGLHQVNAEYHYEGYDDAHNIVPTKTKIKLVIRVQQEVVGHFSKMIVGNNNKLSISKDFLPSSSLEFRRNELDINREPYIICAYIEGNKNQEVNFSMKRYRVDDFETYNLGDIYQYVLGAKAERLLLTVSRQSEELFRAEFLDELNDIINIDNEWNMGRYSEILALPILTLDPVYISSVDSIPEKSIIYGTITENEKKRIVTHGFLYGLESSNPNNPIQCILLGLLQDDPDKNILFYYLKKILSSPEISCKFIQWITKAKNWDYPNDILPYLRLFEIFPVIAVWSDVARADYDSETTYPLLTPEAQFNNYLGNYMIPHLRNLYPHPRFSPEFMTLNDFRILDKMDLIPKDEESKGGVKDLIYFMSPYKESGKPVLSWLTLFWGIQSAEQTGRRSDFSLIWKSLCTSSAVSAVEYDYIKSIPLLRDDRARQQDLRSEFLDEQTHYIHPLVIGLDAHIRWFFDVVCQSSFSTGLASLIANNSILRLASPNIEGLKRSPKWSAIIYLSLYAVSYQLEKDLCLEQLNNLYPLSQKEFNFLIPWISSHNDTAHIYNSYYEYWMFLFWRSLDV